MWAWSDSCAAHVLKMRVIGLALQPTGRRRRATSCRRILKFSTAGGTAAHL